MGARWCKLGIVFLKGRIVSTYVTKTVDLKEGAAIVFNACVTTKSSLSRTIASNYVLREKAVPRNVVCKAHTVSPPHLFIAAALAKF